MAQSYLLEWNEKRQRFEKYNVKPYVPDTQPLKGDYPVLKKREIDGEHGIEYDPGKWFTENDLKVSVDHTKLLVLPQPWIFIQGYWHDDHWTISLRLEPAQELAWLRIKDDSMGPRQKMRIRMPYDMAEAMIYHAHGVAYKFRFIKRDNTGRAWLIEYFPEYDHWQAETEIGGDTPYPERFPVWAGQDMSHLQQYYTHAYVIPRGEKEIQGLIKEAAEYGSREMYEPGSGSKKFNWLGEKK